MKLEAYQVEAASVPELIGMVQDHIMGGRIDGFDPINDGAQRDAMIRRYVGCERGVKIVETPDRFEIHCWTLEKPNYPRGVSFIERTEPVPVLLMRAMLIIVAGGGGYFE